MGLISYPWPSITCARAYIGREKVVAAFERYHNAKGAQQGCHFVQRSDKNTSNHDLSINDKARLDVVNDNAIHSNTTPIAFWTMYHIFSDPAVLDEVRAEVLPLVTTKEENGKKKHEIDISKIREVPILSSVLHESLRQYVIFRSEIVTDS